MTNSCNVGARNDTTSREPHAAAMLFSPTEDKMKSTGTHLYVKAISLGATLAGVSLIAALGGKFRIS
jgi:hypothetical protein